MYKQQLRERREWRERLLCQHMRRLCRWNFYLYRGLFGCRWKLYYVAVLIVRIGSVYALAINRQVLRLLVVYGLRRDKRMGTGKAGSSPVLLVQFAPR